LASNIDGIFGHLICDAIGLPSLMGVLKNRIGQGFYLEIQILLLVKA
jgi:hypothetical protein